VLEDQGEAAEGEGDIRRVEVAPKPPGLLARLDQDAEGAEDPDPRLEAQTVVRGEDGVQDLGHAVLRGHVVEESKRPCAQGVDRIELGEQFGRGIAQPPGLRAVDRVDQGLPGGEVPVERADADAGLVRDGLQRRLLAAARKRAGRDRDQPVVVLLRVGAESTFPDVGQGTLLWCVWLIGADSVYTRTGVGSE
jgi:hypothetical protein